MLQYVDALHIVKAARIFLEPQNKVAGVEIHTQVEIPFRKFRAGRIKEFGTAGLLAFLDTFLQKAYCIS